MFHSVNLLKDVPKNSLINCRRNTLKGSKIHKKKLSYPSGPSLVRSAVRVAEFILIN